MNKKGGAMGVLLLLFLIIILAGALYYLYLNLPGETKGFKQISPFKEDKIDLNSKKQEDTNYTKSKQFYQNMRFPDRDISYYISDSCDDKKKGEVLEAFSILESRTSLIFDPGNNKADSEMLVVCSELAPEPEQEGHFIAGEGGPTKIINTSLYSVILSGKMSLYRDDGCETTHVALHELLHVLGFDHNDNPKSILYPTLDCKQTLDQYFVDELNSLYEDDGLPDLKIVDVKADKSGRYLNFNISIVNQGLKDVSKTKLKVYGDEDIIKFRDENDNEVGWLELNNIEIGTTKILTVTNAKLPSRFTKKISFVVDEKDNIKELFEDNNKVELVVE